MAKRAAPEVNAGSMADIAFLLLIFFLVTTTIEVDSGIMSQLPPEYDEKQPPPEVKEKNVFQVIVNMNNQLLVEKEEMDIKDLSAAAEAFLDNGGGTQPGSTCSYCQGKRDPLSSDNPKKAVVSLFNDRQTANRMYITVYNELVKAYTNLRNREALSRHGELYTVMVDRLANWPKDDRESPEYFELESKIDQVTKLYPRNLSEGESENK